MITVTAVDLESLRVQLDFLLTPSRPRSEATTESDSGKSKCSRCDGIGRIPEQDPVYLGWRYCPECHSAALAAALRAIRDHIRIWHGGTPDALNGWLDTLRQLAGVRF